MSLVVAVRSDRGIVMGADSRGTIGDPRGLTAINDSQKKLFGIGCCGLGLVGSAEMGLTLLDELRKRGICDTKDIDSALSVAVIQARTLFNSWFGNIPPQQRPAVLLTLCGFRNSEAPPVPMIYMMASQQNFAPQLYENSPCMTGVPQYAVYLVHRYYDGSIAHARALAFAEYLISETASQDPKVGGPVKIAEVLPDSGYRELSPDEIRNIHDGNDELNNKLRRFFLEGAR